ncbi:MAG: hypothetical protein VX278_10340 [Myxococcota bacterium]|nr:hypothetical protein [Myxococcota bacterium]
MKHSYLISLFVIACTSDTGTKSFNANPEATITSHSSGTNVTVGEIVTFRGQVSDASHQNEELEAAWYVGERNLCPWQNTNNLGETSCEIDFLASDSNVVLEVRDPEGAAGRDEISIQVAGATEENETPTCVITNPQNDSTTTNGEEILFTALTSDDNPVTSLSVYWQSDKDGILGSSIVNSAGEISFVTAGLSAQTHTIALLVSDEQEALCIDSIIVRVEDSNAPPNQPIFSIQPAPAYTGDDLSVLFSDQSDPNGDLLTMEYLWLKNGVPTAITSETLLHTETSKGDLWTVEITPFDGELYGPIGSASIVIENHPPIVSNVVISPSNPYLGDTLLCSAQFDDPDDSNVGLEYRWVNATLGVDLSAGDTLSLTPALASKGDEIQCVVTATDGSGDQHSDHGSVYVENSLPTAPSIAIVPTTPLEEDDLLCEVVSAASDMDGDSISYTMEWTVDGVLWQGSTYSNVHPQDSISYTETTEGELWSCTATPNDGTADGASGSSAEVEIAADRPAATIDFEDCPNGAAVTDQYLSLGVLFSGSNNTSDPTTHNYGVSTHTRVLISHNWYDPIRIDFVDPNDPSVHLPVQHVSFDNPIDTEIDYIQADVYSESGVLLDSILSASPDRIDFTLNSPQIAYVIVDDDNSTAYVIDNLSFY